MAVARLAVLAAVVLGALVAISLTGSLSAQRIRDWGEGSGVWGVVVFVALSASLTVALVPGPLLAGASGLLFGTALGTPVSVCAATLGAVVAFSLSRAAGRRAVVQHAPPRVLAAADWVGRRGFTGVLLARLAPGVPYSWVNYAAGLTSLRLVTFATATAVGCAPRAFAYTALGGQLGSLGSWQTVVALAVLVGMAALGLALAARDAELRATVARLRLRRA